MDKVLNQNENYTNLVDKISASYANGQRQALRAANIHLLETYWQIGKYIVEYDQNGNIKAEYGQGLLEKLARDLTAKFGKGFSRSNLNYMRLVYRCYPICEEVPHKLSWTHLCELVKIDDPIERQFYAKQTLLENWSTTQLKRQKNTSLFLRLALSKDKEGIMKLAREGHVADKPQDLIREPYILEFLKVPEPYRLNESDLEKHLIDNLQHFLLELGKGFAFIGRQYRITLDNTHYYVDLVFYHRILKCFVLIDLKKEAAGYADVGQMNMYLGYFENEENTEGDNPPIGIVLAKEKDDLMLKYALHGISSQLFVSKYQLYLPQREELQKLLNESI